MNCPNCNSDGLMIRKVAGFERIFILLTRKRKYRCRDCDNAFRAEDRRSIPRSDEAADAAHQLGARH